MKENYQIRAMREKRWNWDRIRTDICKYWRLQWNGFESGQKCSTTIIIITSDNIFYPMEILVNSD